MSLQLQVSDLLNCWKKERVDEQVVLLTWSYSSVLHHQETMEIKENVLDFALFGDSHDVG